MGIPSLASIFNNYQRTITFQISGDQDLILQITKLNSLYTRLYGNNCNISSVLRAMTLLSAIPYSWNYISISISFSYISISNLTWDVVCFAIQVEFSR